MISCIFVVWRLISMITNQAISIQTHGGLLFNIKELGARASAARLDLSHACSPACMDAYRLVSNIPAGRLQLSICSHSMVTK